MKAFKSIVQFQKEFDTDEKCRAYLEQQRWNGTPACPFCGSINVCRLKTRKLFKCREKECRKQFTVLVGTIYQDTKIPLTKWFVATYILSIHSKGISSLQLANWLGVTQKTAWHLNHRIREMLIETSPELLEGIVEVDETWIGGSLTNQHQSKKEGKAPLYNKTMVFGAVQRGGKVKTKVIPATDIENIEKALEEFVQQGSTMVSDEHRAYNEVGKKYDHRRVNHKEKVYVERHEDLLAHTNNMEGYWNILKKQIDGIHHYVSPKHLQRYCNENAFRFNNRELFQDERFATALANCSNKILQYKTLIGKE